MGTRLVISRLGVILTGLLVVVILTANALAVIVDPGSNAPGGPAAAGKYTSPPTTMNSASQIIVAVKRAAGFLFDLFTALAVVFIILSALFYLTAAGNQTQLDRAKNILIYSIVAIVIALIAGGIVSFVGDVGGV